MKNRYLPLITISLAVLLVGSIAYAADKKKKVKQTTGNPGELTEEALKVELLAGNGDPLNKSLDAKDVTALGNIKTNKGKIAAHDQ